MREERREREREHAGVGVCAAKPMQYFFCFDVMAESTVIYCLMTSPGVTSISRRHVSLLLWAVAEEETHTYGQDE